MTINTKDPTHISWRGMKERCFNKKHKDYHSYGGRGIQVCKRWYLFENFLQDMGHRPKEMTLDRIDSNKDYEPGNCRWATATTQARNSRHVVLTEDDIREIRALKGKMTQKEIGKRFGIIQNHVSKIQRGDLWGDVI